MTDRILDWAISNFDAITLALWEHPIAILAVAAIAFVSGYLVARWYYLGRVVTLKEKLGLVEPARAGIRNQTHGVFTEGGVSEPISMRLGALSIKGEFSARVQLQRDSGGGWGVVNTFTSPTECTIEDALPFRYRLKCDQLKRGVIQYTLIGTGG